MSIKSRIAAVAVAALVATAGIAATTQQAQAGGGGGGGPNGAAIGAGLATGLIVGTAIAASQQPAYGPYPVRRCWWQPQYNVFGQYVGSMRACNYY
jgi:hypothetical protein